ncbi:hypothetical protein KSS87_019056, partial [Heliosperma pusillum]
QGLRGSLVTQTKYVIFFFTLSFFFVFFYRPISGIEPGYLSGDDEYCQHRLKSSDTT